MIADDDMGLLSPAERRRLRFSDCVKLSWLGAAVQACVIRSVNRRRRDKTREAPEWLPQRKKYRSLARLQTEEPTNASWCF
jgi:hypothetical protein